MKIGIHHRPGSFSERWIQYCKQKNIEYKLVNCYDNNIIKQMNDCDILMWHHSHVYYKDVLFAKPLLYSLRKSGKKVFPDFDTNWYFDDKVGQKYLLESIRAPLVPSYVFYTKKEAIIWAKNTSFPKVFKLRGGAGSANVRMVETQKKAIRLIKKAFGKGTSQFDRLGHLKERIRKYKIGKDSLIGVCKGIGRLFIPTEYAKLHNREKGYVYFQDFIPNNKYDIRIIIIGNNAFGIKRIVRHNDFRASGSGNIIYDKKQIDINCVKIAFDINRKLNAQSIGFDFVFDVNNNPLIVEIGYGFTVNVYDQCEGYWDSNMKWHEEKFCPQTWMIENLISE